MGARDQKMSWHGKNIHCLKLMFASVNFRGHPPPKCSSLDLDQGNMLDGPKE